jgi:hypothetical protein
MIVGNPIVYQTAGYKRELAGGLSRLAVMARVHD